MRRLTVSFLAVPTLYLVRNVTVVYARWWHTVTGATYGAEHISGLVLSPKRKATALALVQSKDSPLFRESLSQKKKKKRAARSAGGSRKALLHLSTVLNLGLT